MPTQLLEGQRAVVTGSSSGIGEALARGFAEAGAAVIVNYRSGKSDAERIAAEIEQRGGRAIPVEADVSQPEGCKRLFDAADEHLGGVDILAANAGIQRDAAFAEMRLEEWREVIDVNLTGQFLCAQDAVRRFRKQGLDQSRSAAPGKIIFTSSVHQAIPWAGHANYAAVKGGLKLLMESMAQELSSQKIRSRPGLSKLPAVSASPSPRPVPMPTSSGISPASSNPRRPDRRGSAADRSTPSTNPANLSAKRDETGATDQLVRAKPHTAAVSNHAITQRPGE